MNVRERVLTCRLVEKIYKNPEVAARIGLYDESGYRNPNDREEAVTIKSNHER